MSLILIALLIVCSAAGCTSEPAPVPNADAVTAIAANAPCDSVQRVDYLPPALVEASGLTASHVYPGILWTHNDDDLVVFAIDTLAKQHARVRLATGAGAIPAVGVVDAEDIALARCGDHDCIYLADIGDNHSIRKSIRILRFHEPDPARDSVTQVADIFEAKYPDAASRDAEAIFILPPERVFVVTKGRSSSVALYAWPGPLRPGVVTLKHVQNFTAGIVQFPGMVTGGSASYDGSRVALRTYGFLRLYTPAGGDSLRPIPADSLALTAVHEFQGEGIALRDDGTVFLVGEKGLDTVPPSLIRMSCAR